MRTMQQRLKKKNAKTVAKQISKNAGVELVGEMDKVEVGGQTVILVGGEPIILEHEERYYLTVYGALKLKPKRWKVVVDEGALPYIMNGADIMKPGIVHADEGIKKDDFVYITVEGKDVPIAVGIALVDGVEMQNGKGKAVKNIHHLKDKVWNHFFRNAR